MFRLLQILFFILIFFLLNVFPQTNDAHHHENKEPRKLMMNSHDPNLKSLPQTSFYKRKADWQYIIDTTWGPGLPLAQKQQIFNTFTASITNSFDGFQSLGMTLASWDSLKNYYYSRIDSTTSRGRFSAIMNYLCSKLRDRHTHADDDTVLGAPLNPGIPYLVTSGYFNAEHLGAVSTVLPDSSIMILSVVNNHPLSLEPGDIILGYEGVHWKDLIVELMEAELPNSDWWGNSSSCFTNNLFVTAGMNWHLFDTMDVLKYSTGDTVHLSIAPLANLNLPSMLNNEQIGIHNIPFPDYFNNEFITYGIIENTNVGYIYIYSHYDPQMNQKMFEAINSLKNTDGLIIDMRYTYGGWTYNIWPQAFQILTNENKYPLSDALRCSPTNWTLCPTGDSIYYVINGGSGTLKYESPIAVLLGPNCGSMGDINAYRLASLYNVRTFGKSTWAGLGTNEPITNFSGWTLNYSVADVYHLNNPGYYLNRKEFPIDYPVWHNRDDVALGKDAVVEKALWWINNLVYPHNTTVNKFYYSPSNDTVNLSTIIENPNSHQLLARGYFYTLNNNLIDSVDLVKQTTATQGENWKGIRVSPSNEGFFKVAVKVIDQTDTSSFRIPNAIRFTTAGPIKLDSIVIKKQFSTYSAKLYLHNFGSTIPVSNGTVRLLSSDPWVTNLSTTPVGFPLLAAGTSVSSGTILFSRIDPLYPGYYNFKVEVMSDGWKYWIDSITVITEIDDEIQKPLTFKLEQNYPNPFNPSTTISYSVPCVGARCIVPVQLKVYDVLGNEVATLVEEFKPAGNYEIEFQSAVGSKQLASGIYFYQLKAGDFVETKKMILLR